MSDKIAALPGAKVGNQTKQQMLDYLAQRWDELAERGEPVAMVFALVNVTGGCHTGYLTATEIDDRNSLHVARGVACINMDMHLWEQR